VNVQYPVTKASGENRSQIASHKNALSIGLQGGGSFGAFTWGVLDRLLDEKNIQLDALSGASAGSVNAVLLASGLLENRMAAKSRLERFWRNISEVASYVPHAAFSAFIQMYSPYQFNPLNLNPLRNALLQEVDFQELRASPPVRLLIAATSVRDGRQRIFREHELTVDMVLASTCLPLLNHAVSIEGEDYWDGGYVSNPPLFSLALASEAEDILAVLVTPNSTAKTPRGRQDIVKRLEMIQFNASVNTELAALKLGAILQASPKFERLKLTSISAADEIDGLARESAGDLSWAFLNRLRQSGIEAAESWLLNQKWITRQ
jgi:NTE family protein